MADLNYNLVFRPGRYGFWFAPATAIDSEHSQKGPYQFSGPSKQFEKDIFCQIGEQSADIGHRLVGRLLYLEGAVFPHRDDYYPQLHCPSDSITLQIHAILRQK